MTDQPSGAAASSTATETRPASPPARAGASQALIRRVALLGNHLPRQCGIATFTSHLAEAIGGLPSAPDCFVLAMNDPGRQHAYPGRVRFEIAEADAASYRRAADYLNVNDVDVVCVQHEFGIFGGKAGGHLLPLLRDLRMPIVTTLHTVLPTPSLPQRRVIDEIAQVSQRMVVMSSHGAELLHSVYQVPRDRIDLIPHGIPEVPPALESKHRLGVSGRTVLLTFGLLSPDKGIELVIDALPAIVEMFPEVVYIVLGATHPHVKDEQGESYRVMLESRVRQLGVEHHVIFHDRFVGQDELNEFLGASDVYITPYLNPEQSTSGTLAYAVGSGRAVISTPYAYARELLADERGVLVPWRDAGAIAAAVRDLLADDGRRAAMQRSAAAYGRTMSWPAVAVRYHESFARAVREQATEARATFQASTLARRGSSLPEVSLRHVRALTDDTGLLQHASFTVPRYSEGYCLDDNARALMLLTRIEEAGTNEQEVVRALSTRYLAFVHAAFDTTTGRFRNFLSYGRQWTDGPGSEDSHGRGVHALGTVVGRSTTRGRSELAADLFHAAVPAVDGFTSPRAWATTLLGIDEYLHAFEGDRRVEALRGGLADRLHELYVRAGSDEWPWFEHSLTYANAQLPHALIASGARMRRADLVSAGLRTLTWLLSVQRSAEDHFAPVGTDGFSVKGAPAARFDQQPIEAATTVAACLEAERVTRDAVWLERAGTAFHWFLGRNHLHRWLYDAASGGCRDGLHAERLNENQGAESTLAFLLALVDMRGHDRATIGGRGPRG